MPRRKLRGFALYCTVIAAVYSVAIVKPVTRSDAKNGHDYIISRIVFAVVTSEAQPKS